MSKQKNNSNRKIRNRHWRNPLKFLMRKRIITTVFTVYFIVCLLYYYFFVRRWPQTELYLERFGKGFGVSFSASLSEDLIVFLALSFIVLILTTRELIDHGFETKVRAIINSTTALNDEGLYNFLSYSLSQVLCYDKHREIKVTIADYDEEQGAYKLYFEQIYLMANMCKDKDIKKEKYYFEVSPADASVNGEFGFVTMLKLVDRNTNAVLLEVTKPTKPYKLTEKFSEAIDFSLSKNSECDVLFNFHTWSKTGDICDSENLNILNYVKFDRYSNKTKIAIENQLDKAISIEIYTRNNQKNIVSLHKKATIHQQIDGQLPYTFLVPIELYPKDDVRIFFHKPKGDDNEESTAR